MPSWSIATPARRLADVDALGRGRREVEQRGCASRSYTTTSARRSSSAPRTVMQPGVAGSGADQVDGHPSRDPRRADPDVGEQRCAALARRGGRRPTVAADRGGVRRPTHVACAARCRPSSDASSASSTIAPSSRRRRERAARQVAAAAELGEERPLGVEGARARRRRRSRRACASGRGVVGAALDRERALPDLRQHHRRLEHLGRVVAQAEAVERGDARRPPRRSRAPCSRRVGMLPRSSANARSGRSAASWARRRTEPVPTRAAASAGRRASSRRARRAGRPVPGTPPSTRPSGVTAGRSLAECTARSAVPRPHGLLDLLHEHAGARRSRGWAPSVAVAGASSRSPARPGLRGARRRARPATGRARCRGSRRAVPSSSRRVVELREVEEGGERVGVELAARPCRPRPSAGRSARGAAC